MTYRTTGPIQATDYNNFAGILNSIYSDNQSGTTQVNDASFGYGQKLPLPTVEPWVAITAADWTDMFALIHK